jgi:hypothetical protein
VRGAERRYNAPLLTAGTRLVLPADVKAVPVLDYYHRPRLARAASAWPHIKAADGTTVDAATTSPGRRMTSCARALPDGCARVVPEPCCRDVEIRRDPASPPGAHAEAG